MIITIAGPTGTGKSALALALARRWAQGGVRAEIVNADAMQLYRGMNIGTAKLSVAERQGVPHHLFDVLEVTDEASVARYQQEARDAIADIQHRGSVPILVGGSGLYVAATLTDFQFPGTDRGRREHWQSELDRRGPSALHAELAARDARAAEAIGPHNGRRLVRALEVGDITGRPFSAGLDARSRPWRPYRQFALTLDREPLVARLNERVRGMWRDGLLDEVEHLLTIGLDHGATASRAIGYAQAIAQLRNETTQGDAIAQTQALTRRYARRQMSWFRRDAATEWCDAGSPDLVNHIVDEVASELASSMEA